MIRPRLTLLALAIPLALAGCALGPDYQRPDARVALPDSYAGEPVAGALTTTPAVAGRWWTLFGDTQLDALVDQALTSSPDALTAAARVEEADAVLRQVNAALLPQIDANAGISRSRSILPNAVEPTGLLRNTNRIGLSTSFELDVWGRLRRASEAARAQALGTRYTSETVSLSLAASVTQAYLNLRALDAQLLVNRDSVSSQAKSTQLARVRFDGGYVSQLDVQQAEGALATYTAAQVQLEKNRALAESLLGLLVGQPGLKVAAGDLRSLPVPPTPPAGLPSSLLEARPDVRKAETDLIAANAKIGVAKAALFPSITLTGSLGRESRDLSDLFSPAAAVWSIGAGLTQPIFEGGRLRAQVEQVSAQQKQSLEAYRKSVQTAFREVNDALITVRQNGDSEVALGQAVQAAKRSLQLAQARYDSGYSPYLEVLTAQRTSNDATLAWVQNRQARLSSSVDLFKALGGGWKDGNAPQAAAR
ncbi:efflux transporter outer membrane subunit [Zoogloea sp.]|uniref:efflux transporter outer membrane subunit n=1 Tax=Zoogloea sp. TaxID=49181 RepID=UPI001E19961C|nr:efflux transporter outer membrane subunit [Zoogloea sp.]MBK6654350.1 efflux transporter outer membrane subunit [Zoogloea sp.]HOY01986.1 efflux transporter outer membrane subunit [Zoogloea sp.]